MSAVALVRAPHPFLSDVDFADASTAVAEWSNCPLPATESWCRVAFTATGDGWHTARVLPYFDKPDAETGEQRAVFPLTGGTVLSELTRFEVVDRSNHRHRVTVSHRPLPLTGDRTELGLVASPSGATAATGNDTLYDPATRSLHPLPGGGLLLLTAHTDRAGRLSAVRFRLGRPICQASVSTDGGLHWHTRFRIVCSPAPDNIGSTTVTIGARLVIFSPADPAGHVPADRGRFWITITRIAAGQARTVRENWAGQDFLTLSRVGSTLIVSGENLKTGRGGWRTVDPANGRLGPIHLTTGDRLSPAASTGGDVAWETGNHQVLVYNGSLKHPRLVDPR